ncbi:MAG: hypothetical protein J6M92_06085 [Oribacterium sp.]|nr:hypothetical protein [Oribacterium sp.]
MGIQVGDPVSIDYPVIELGKHRVGGKAMDDRALVFMLIEVLKMLKDEDDTPDLYAVFTTQEEAGATDASFIQTLNGGIRSGGIQIPMRYVHSYEVVDVRDMVNCIELLYHFIKKTEVI